MGLHSFAELKAAIEGVMPQIETRSKTVGLEESVARLEWELDDMAGELRVAIANCSTLAAYVTSTDEYYRWLLERRPYANNERLSNLRLALIFLSERDGRHVR